MRQFLIDSQLRASESVYSEVGTWAVGRICGIYMLEHDAYDQANKHGQHTAITSYSDEMLFSGILGSGKTVLGQVFQES